MRLASRSSRRGTFRGGALADRTMLSTDTGAARACHRDPGATSFIGEITRNLPRPPNKRHMATLELCPGFPSCLLGALLGRFKSSWAVLGLSWGRLGALLAVWRVSWGRPWGRRGALSGRLRSLPESLLGQLEALLGPSWAVNDPSWGRRGPMSSLGPS